LADLVVGGAAIAVYAILMASGDYLVGAGRRRARKELGTVPPLDASSVEGTIVRVTGIVRATGATLVAPLSGIECVAVRAVVGPRLFRSPVWMKMRVWSAIVPFALDRDGEPPILVDGDHARINLESIEQALPRGWAPATHRKRMELREAMRKREQQLLQKLELPRTVPAQFLEWLVRPGTRVTIAGVLALDEPSADGGERGFRDLAPRARRIAGDADRPLVIGKPVMDRAS
jgi:hypothetical protein